MLCQRQQFIKKAERQRRASRAKNKQKSWGILPDERFSQRCVLPGFRKIESPLWRHKTGEITKDPTPQWPHPVLRSGILSSNRIPIAFVISRCPCSPCSKSILVFTSRYCSCSSSYPFNILGSQIRQMIWHICHNLAIGFAFVQASNGPNCFSKLFVSFQDVLEQLREMESLY